MLTQQEIQERLNRSGITPQSSGTQSKRTPINWDNIGGGSEKKESFLTKFGKTGGKILGGLSKFSGIESGVDMLGSIGEGATYGVAKLTGNKKLENQILEHPISESMKIANEKGTMAGVKDVLGKTLEVGATVAPFAKGAKAATAVSKLGKYGKLAGEGAVYGGAFGASGALQENKNFKDIISKTLSGAAIGAGISAGVPALVEGTVRAAKNVAALYSGVPKEAIERAFDNPDVVGKAVRKYSKDPQATKQILNQANASLKTIKNARSKAYEKALANLPEGNVIDPNVLASKLDDTLGKFNPKVLPNREIKEMNEIVKLYQNWDDFSGKGVNELRQALNNRINIGNSKKLNYVITTLSENLNDEVAKASPQIAEMNKAYADASKFIDDLQSEIFGKTSKMSDSTKLNKLLNIFKQQSDLRTELVTRLGKEAGQDLINEITGAVMSSWLPTGWVQRFVLGGAGLTGLVTGNVPTLAIGAAGASPRIVGKSARVLGKANKAFQSVAPAVKKFGIPAAQKLINK